MNNKIKLITDGASDISPQKLKERNINQVPFYVIDVEIGEDTLISADELYGKMVEDNHRRFKTGCPSIDDYYKVFEKAVKDDNQVICVCITQAFSGSFNSATTAKASILEKYPNAEIEIVDSKMNTVLQGQLVLSISDMIKEDMKFEDILSKVEKLIPTGQIMFSVGTIDYLRYGGRIGLLKSLVAKTLSVKPIIVMKNGDISLGGFGIGVKMALNKVIEGVKSHFHKIGESIKNFKFIVGYGYDKEQGIIFLERCKQMLEISDEDISFDQIGSTSAVHVGPHTIGIGFLKKYSLV